MIPTHIKQAIEDICENSTYTLRDKPVQRDIEKRYTKAILEQGYSLAEQEIEKLNDEIDKFLETGSSKLTTKIISEQSQEITRLKELIEITATRFYQNGMQQWVSVIGPKRMSTTEDYKIFNKELTRLLQQFKTNNKL